MINQILTLNLEKGSLLTENEIKKLDAEGYFSIDAFGRDTFETCLASFECDPWEYLRSLRVNTHQTELGLLLRGQSLLGRRPYADDTVEFFVEKAIENGIDIIRAYDALNDPRNLMTAVNAAKRLGAHMQTAMIYTESRVHSVAFFAGYAAQLASMGADSICICDPEGLLTEEKVRELVVSLKETVHLPLAVSSMKAEVAKSAYEAGVDMINIFSPEELETSEMSPQLSAEIELVRDEAGYPPLASPISDIIREQAELNLASGERYAAVTEDFKMLVKGGYGRTPAPIDQSFIQRICGNEPLVLVRPADMLATELDSLREKSAPWYEQEEDVLTAALFGESAEKFFEVRKAKKYALDIPHANAALGIHTV